MVSAPVNTQKWRMINSSTEESFDYEWVLHADNCTISGHQIAYNGSPCNFRVSGTIDPQTRVITWRCMGDTHQTAIVECTGILESNWLGIRQGTYVTLPERRPIGSFTGAQVIEFPTSQ